jgi:hypothetical protein
MSNLTLVLHFNAYTGKLQCGYLMHRGTNKPVGGFMKPADILAYLTAHPDAECAPIKV